MGLLVLHGSLKLEAPDDFLFEFMVEQSPVVHCI